jgi:DNA-binding MarR family transcriptional regulator
MNYQNDRKSSEDLEQLESDFAALANKIRLRIIVNLYNAYKSGQELNMLEAISPYDDLPRSSITNHVQKLEKQGFIQREKRGREVFLTLSSNWEKRIKNFLNIFSI